MTRAPIQPQRAAIYARLSVATEESVSIDRQIESARNYARALGYDVVLISTDEDVSATKKRPEDRPWWRAILESPERFDVVIVWKIDRLCRSVLDFLNTHEALKERNAAVRSVDNTIDMTSPQGRAFATMLAVFAEMEAAATSGRVKASTAYLKQHTERLSGGERPWPYSKTRNPDGPGYVLRPIPERAAAIQAAAADLIAGRTTVSGIARRWDSQGLVPKRKGQRALDTWAPSSVSHLLRNPTLYGATLHRGEPVRNADGSVRITEAHAILSRATWLRVQDALGQAKRGRKPSRPALLSGFARCANCDHRMTPFRPTSRPVNRHAYRCQRRDCSAPVSVAMRLLDFYVLNTFLERFGALPRLTWQEGPAGPDAEAVAVLEADLQDVLTRIAVTDDEDEWRALAARRTQIREDLDRLRARGRTTPKVVTLRGPTYAEILADAENADIAAVRDVLTDLLVAVHVSPGERGKHGLDPDRVDITWDEGAVSDAVADYMESHGLAWDPELSHRPAATGRRIRPSDSSR